MDLSGHDNARLRYEVFDIHFQDLHCETCVTSNSDVVDNWARMVMEIVETKIMVGLSISWSPPAGADRNGVRKPSLLQLCFDDNCLIFELWREPNSHCPKFLLRLFASTNVYFFGFDIRRNEGYLFHHTKICIHNLVDFQDWALSTPGLQAMPRDVIFGMEMGDFLRFRLNKRYKKPHTVMSSSWNQPLTRQQVFYASVDALMSYVLGVDISK